MTKENKKLAQANEKKAKNRQNREGQKNNRQSEKNPKMSFRATLKTQWYIWKLCFKTSPGFMIYFIFDAFRYEANVFLEHALGIRYVLQCAENHEPFWKPLVFIGAILVYLMIMMIPDGYWNHAVMYRYKPRLYQALKEQLFEKASRIDLACYDDPAYYNDFVLAVSEAESSIDRFLEILKNAVMAITVIITTGTFYLLVDPSGLIFVFISFGLRYLLGYLLNKLNIRVRLKANPEERKRNYVSRVFYLKDFAKELRLYPKVANRLEKEFDEANQEILKENQKASGKRIWYLFAMDYLTGDFLTDGLYVAYLIFSATVLKTVSYADAVVLFNRMGSLRRSMLQLSQIPQRIHENGMYVEKIQTFLKFEPKVEIPVGDPVPEGIGELCLDHVSFRYTENGPDILKDISLKVQPGEHIAIVGYNGAGKTTLIKLLMRLYDPTEGAISYHGESVSGFHPTDYRKRIGVVFQDYQVYGANLAENVVLDRMSEEEIEKKSGKITDALCSAGFGERLAKLPKGLYSSVTTEFDKDGTDFSGGESQKIAISRAFYKDADILIMDEPSSALDPLAEYELNKAMKKAAEGKTVFYISHRLSTTRDADRIVMIENGRIVEEGTHEELLNLDGKYAEMWNVQASNYR